MPEWLEESGRIMNENGTGGDFLRALQVAFHPAADSQGRHPEPQKASHTSAKDSHRSFVIIGVASGQLRSPEREVIKKRKEVRMPDGVTISGGEPATWFVAD